MYVILTVVISILTIKGESVIEQQAFNYFASEVFAKSYSGEKRIYFSGETENISSIGGPFSKCFVEDGGFSAFYYNHKEDLSNNVLIDSDNFDFVKASSKAKKHSIYLMIYRSVRRNNMNLVYLVVVKKKHFAHHYLIKISSKTNKVEDVCLEYEIM